MTSMAIMCLLLYPSSGMGFRVGLQHLLDNLEMVRVTKLFDGFTPYFDRMRGNGPTDNTEHPTHGAVDGWQLESAVHDYCSSFGENILDLYQLKSTYSHQQSDSPSNFQQKIRTSPKLNTREG